MEKLLRIETPFAVVEINGNPSPKAALLSGQVWPIPRISAAPSSANAEITKWFPLLFEEVDYEIFVQSLISEEKITVSHRDPRTLNRVRNIPNAVPSTVFGTLRFSQSVGLTTFTVSVGQNIVDITLEVFPSKLDYLDDYDAMVSDVRDLDRALPLRYFDETFTKLGLAGKVSGSTLEWLSILRSHAEGLQRALRYADAHPLISLEQHEHWIPTHKVRRSTAQVRSAVRQGHGNGPYVETKLGIPVRSVIPVDSTRDSLDCVEHRWIRANLSHITNTLTRLSQRLRTEDELRRRRFRATSSNTQKPQSNLILQAKEVEELTVQINSLKSLQIVSDASRSLYPSGFSSLRILRTPGYGETYRIILALRLGLSHSDGDVEVSVARMGTLYEAWCFVEVVRIIEEITGAQLLHGLQNFIAESSLGKRLVKGKSAQATFEIANGRRLAVRYNREYSGLTGTQKPDIELEFIEDGRPGLIVLLDAKYRVDASEEQVDFNGLASPPPDAIGALHRYRDAIVMNTKTATGTYRPVVRGAALYPLSKSESESFVDSKLARALSVYGIGAIPLLPGNSEFLRKWLTSLLAMPYHDLAWNGPPGPTN